MVRGSKILGKIGPQCKKLRIGYVGRSKRFSPNYFFLLGRSIIPPPKLISPPALGWKKEKEVHESSLNGLIRLLKTPTATGLGLKSNFFFLSKKWRVFLKGSLSEGSTILRLLPKNWRLLPETMGEREELDLHTGGNLV